MDKLWGPHDFDRFADDVNKKCIMFNSESNHENSSGVDAFEYDWSRYNNWVVPPAPLISSAIKHMQATRCRGSLVVPRWRAAVFWPLLVGERGFFKDFVNGSLEFPSGEIFSEGSRNRFFNAQSKFDMLFLKTDCS